MDARQREMKGVRLRVSKEKSLKGAVSSRKTAEEYTLFNTYVHEYEDAVDLLHSIKSSQKLGQLNQL